MSTEQPPKPKPRCDTLEQCPRCRIMAWEAERTYGRGPRYLTKGTVDCPNCPGVFSVKPDAPRGEAELLEGELEESIEHATRDMLGEDKRKGKHGGGGGGSSGRKPPPKRATMAVRWEQEPVGMFANGHGGGDIKGKPQQYEQATRYNLQITADTKMRLERWAYREGRIRNRKIHMVDGIRAALKASVQITRVCEFEQLTDLEPMQVLLYEQEVGLIKAQRKAHNNAPGSTFASTHKATWGEVVETYLLAWLPGVE